MPSPRPRSPVPNGSYGIGLGYPSVNRGRKSGLRSRATQLLALRFGWVVLVIWYEVGEFFRSLSTCKFPDSQLRSSPSRGFLSRAPVETPPTHLVLLADPHVAHPIYSYPMDSRPWINKLRQAMDELFMRKSWNVVMRLGRVDDVIVLGDMLDYGRGVMSEYEYEEYVDLFASIFQLPPSVPMYFIPGNHDLPLGPSRAFSSHARDRYVKHFSPPNAVLEVSNHSIILLDAVGLVEEDYRRYAAEMQFGEWDGVEGGVIEFVKTLGDIPPTGPKILLSHIPLNRPDKATCGPLRETGKISKGAGPGYQNLLGSETSRFLLDELHPDIIFSGDDHDYCDFTHPGGIREVTVKSFSSSAGIRRPGFHLLSLIPPSDSTPYTQQLTHADRPCFLPDQMGVYWQVYLPMAILTVFFLFGSNVWAAWERWTANGYSIYSDLKSRLSPNMMAGEKLGTPTMIRRNSERPNPSILPSRRSSQQLSAMAGPSSSKMDYLSYPYPRNAFSHSAPVSPSGSPRTSPNRQLPASNGKLPYEDDEESVIDHTSTLSRSSSYRGVHPRAENPYETPRRVISTPESSSYFLPLPGDQDNGIGLGLSPSLPGVNGDPRTNGMKRSSSTTAVGIGSIGPYSQPLTTSYSASGSNLTPTRRLTSGGEFRGSAMAKDKSVLELPMVGDSLPPHLQRRRSSLAGAAKTVQGFVRALWKTRNGVIWKSWREAWAVAWPPAVTWILINGLFFLK